MKLATALISLAALLSIAASIFEPRAEAEKYWPQWRGPHYTGVAPQGSPPLIWSEEKNVRWKIEIPGKGSASPIVWGDLLFIATAIPAEASKPASNEPAAGPRRRNIAPTHSQKFVILAIKRKDGSIVWQRTTREALPHEGTHPDGTWASNSPVTDGERVYAHFGSNGLYCYDLQGKLLWEKDLGDMATRNGFGEGSSPALHGNFIIVNWDHEGQSFIVALDKRTGKEIWKADRDEITSWATPLIVEHQGKPQVITNATNRVRSYDLATGKVLWETSGMTVNTIPSPVCANNMVYVTSGFRGSALLAIRLDAAQGDLANSNAIVWRYDQDTPYVPSPLLYGDCIYFLKVNSGILSCFNATTGAENYGRQRLEGINSIYSSPVAARDRVYLTSRDGATLVIKHGAKFEVLATNSLADGFDASAAIVDNEFYLRGRKFLYCLAEK